MLECQATGLKKIIVKTHCPVNTFLWLFIAAFLFSGYFQDNITWTRCCKNTECSCSVMEVLHHLTMLLIPYDYVAERRCAFHMLLVQAQIHDGDFNLQSAFVVFGIYVWPPNIPLQYSLLRITVVSFRLLSMHNRIYFSFELCHSWIVPLSRAFRMIHSGMQQLFVSHI